MYEYIKAVNYPDVEAFMADYVGCLQSKRKGDYSPGQSVKLAEMFHFMNQLWDRGKHEPFRRHAVDYMNNHIPSGMGEVYRACLGKCLAEEGIIPLPHVKVKPYIEPLPPDLTPVPKVPWWKFWKKS